jgi:Pyruvate/2-oxoacid:ferredoxin oxidoreductase delta subunit
MHNTTEKPESWEYEKECEKCGEYAMHKVIYTTETLSDGWVFYEVCQKCGYEYDFDL